MRQELPFDLTEDDGSRILLLTKNTVIKYLYTRFLLAISDQANLSPWAVAHQLADNDRMYFENYYLPFYKGEAIWVEEEKKLGIVCRSSMVSMPPFWALNPIQSEEISNGYKEDLSE